jgi:CRISPR/Cas system-associated exonuclease Cas4 (RecB family)
MKLKYAPYSYSMVGTFKNCPYRFKLQYIDKIRTKFNRTPALEKGSFLHKGIELYLKDELDEKIKDYKFTTLNEDEKKEIFTTLKKILKGKNIQFYKSFNNLYIEEGFGLNLLDNDVEVTEYSNDVDIRGYIDLMFYDDFADTVYIIDHKSGKYRKDQDKLQVSIYYLVAYKMFPNANKFFLNFDFIEHEKTASITKTRDDFLDTLNYVKKQILQVENETEFPKITKFCNWCPYFSEGHCNGIDNSIEEF